jgi:hypothetical protein
MGVSTSDDDWFAEVDKRKRLCLLKKKKKKKTRARHVARQQKSSSPSSCSSFPSPFFCLPDWTARPGQSCGVLINTDRD